MSDVTGEPARPHPTARRHEAGRQLDHRGPMGYQPPPGYQLVSQPPPGYQLVPIPGFPHAGHGWAPAPPAKNSRTGVWLLAAFGAVFLVLVAFAIARGTGTTATAGTRTASGSSSPAPATPSKTFVVGQPVNFTTPDGAGTITINSAERSKANDVFGQPPKHGSFLIIDLVLVVKSGGATANPFGFTAQDAQAYTYNVAAGATPQEIDSSNLTAGQQVRGKLAFDIPPGPVTVTWKTPLGSTVATWTIAG